MRSLLLLCLLGCSPDPKSRKPVTGSVPGEPVELVIRLSLSVEPDADNALALSICREVER